MTNWRLLGGGLVCAVAIAGFGPRAAARTYTIDSSRSRATIAVGKSGALSFAAGHAHEVAVSAIAGKVTVDLADPGRSSVEVTIDASALKVTGKGESAADVPKVQETMLGPQVLDVRRFPTITFASTAVAATAKTAESLDASVTGDLTLHGVAHPITVPVAVRVEGETLTASGRLSVKQTEYGMKPVSVGGVVSVKDAVSISFAIVAR
jgi:polyisoprenoid-binding protein YceI